LGFQLSFCLRLSLSENRSPLLGPVFAVVRPLFQRFGPLRHGLDADAGKRGRKGVFRFGQCQSDHVNSQRRVGQVRIVGVLDGAGGA
jgi:hypothetical protein